MSKGRKMKVVVIGGGPAGMLAAIGAAARRGRGRDIRENEFTSEGS